MFDSRYCGSGRSGEGKPCSVVNFGGEMGGAPVDDVLRKVRELNALVGELEALDRQRVDMGDRLVDLEHYFRKAGCPELSRRALEVFMETYAGRVLELADGMRG